MKNAILLCCILLSVPYYFGYGQANSGTPETELIRQVERSSDVAQKIEALNTLAAYYLNKANNEQKADSLYLLAQQEAETSFDNELIYYSYLDYLKNIPYGYEGDHCLNACDRLIEVATRQPDKDMLYEAYHTVSSACLRASNCHDPVHYATLAFSTATENQDVYQIVSAKLLLGEVMASQNNVAEAFKSYLSARELMERLEPDERKELLFRYDDLMFRWYTDHNNPEKAFAHKLNQIKAVTGGDNIDSMQLMWLKLDQVFLMLQSRDAASLSGRFSEILSYADRVGNEKLRNRALSLYRTWLIQSLRFKELDTLMTERYPRELERIWQNDRGWYFNIMAYIHEARDQPDSAYHYFSRAARYTEESSNLGLQVHFFKRYGEFFLRQNNEQRAIDQFEKSFELAVEHGYDDYAAEVAGQLEDLFRDRGAFREAYAYATQKDSLLTLQYETIYKENLTELEVLSQQKQEEIIAEKAAEAKREKHQRQYFLIVLIVVISSLLLVVISSMQVPEWLIEMMAFFSVLSIFEYIMLMMDKEIYKITEGEPIVIFLIKLLILSILFPLHHLIETNVTAYLKKHKLIKGPKSFTFKRAFARLWPWLRERKPQSGPVNQER